jgi:ankyrin repeat protein
LLVGILPHFPLPSIKDIQMDEDKNKQLPLHAAVIARDIGAVRSLLASGTVDPNLEDDSGLTALIEACVAGDCDIVRLLLGGGCPAQPSAGFCHSPIRGASVTGHTRVIKMLLEAGADPNALSDGQRTALMGGCFLRNTVEGDHNAVSAECCRILLADGRTDPTVVNSFGETALDLAKVRGYEESARLVEEAMTNWRRTY